MGKYTTKAPTGLTITRSDGAFTFSWKIGDKDYGDGQWLCYNVNDGARTGWAKIGNNQTSYGPLNLGAINEVAFWVKGERKKFKNGKKDVDPKKSAEAICVWRATAPYITSLSYSRTSANAGTFSWEAHNDSADTAILTAIQAETVAVRGNENPPAYGWSAISGTSPYAPTESLGGSNLVRWVRVRAVGPAGVSGWSYSYHAYGNPTTPSLTSASAVQDGSSSRITASWACWPSLAYPTDTITIQYAIAVPSDTAFTAPVSGWSDSMTVTAHGGYDSVVAHINDALDDDECMWVRLKAVHDDSPKYSNALLAQIGTLKTPEVNATPNVTTGDIAVSVTVKTSANAVASTVVFYRSEKKPDYDDVKTILPPGTTSCTIHVEEIKDTSIGYSTVGVYSFIGTYNTQTKDGVTTYTLKTVRMRSANAIDTDILARPPAWVGLDEGTHDQSVRISWPWTWTSATSAELTWADHDDAWESTDEPSYYSIEDKTVTKWTIANLEVGKRWYFRVRLKQKDDEDEITGPWSEIYDYDLSSIPDKPALILSKNVIDANGSVTARWAYAAADETTQAYAEICAATISSGVVTYGSIVAHVDESQTVEITGTWTTGTTYYFCLRLTSSAGRQSEWSDPVALFIAPPINLTVTQKSLVTVDNLLYLTEMPLTVTVTGAGIAGKTIISIVRAEDYHIVRPDGSDFDGFESEHIASFSQDGESQVSIGVDNLVGYLDDGAKYKLICTVEDEYGQTKSVEFPFTVAWTHQAGMPSAEVTIDRYQRIAIIKPLAPSNYVSGDVCDIYRISADKPELIYKGAAFGTKYVDPYPAFGDFCGHRIVTRTANGDYITATNELAWFLCDSDIGDIIEEQMMVIDVDGDQIELPYNIQLQSTWAKDFKRTSYLGGSVKGDWNPAVTRDISANTVIVRGADLDAQLSMRNLADYAGLAHIRTPDGSSVAANIQIRETMNYNTATVSYSLTINVIDPEQPEGMTYDEWKSMNPVE